MEIENKIFHYQDDVKISYHDTGAGSPILLIHGLGASSYGWSFITPALSEKYRVLSLDLKGFGLSDKPVKPVYSLKDHAKVIIAFIQHLKLSDITLAGHSLGGAIVLTAYLILSLKNSKEHSVKSLILVDAIAYRMKIPWYYYIFKVPVINRLLINRWTIPVVISPILAKIGRRRLFLDEQLVDEDMAKAYSGYMKQDGARYALVKTMEQMSPAVMDSISSGLGEIRIPVLILWGEKDVAVPLYQGERLNSDITGSRLVVIKDCGHNPHEEKSSETAAAITKFLD